MATGKLSEVKWVTRSGEEIPLSALSHKHLSNVIDHLRRYVSKLEQEFDACYAFTGGEMAEREASIAADTISSKLHNALGWLCLMQHEQTRRKKLRSGDDAIKIMQEALP